MAASSAGTIRTSASKRTVATRFSAARANIAVEETWLFFNDQFALHPTVMDSTENRAFELMSTRVPAHNQLPPHASLQGFSILRV